MARLMKSGPDPFLRLFRLIRLHDRLADEDSVREIENAFAAGDAAPQWPILLQGVRNQAHAGAKEPLHSWWVLCPRPEQNRVTEDRRAHLIRNDLLDLL